jgi:YhcH/YjgK/YiaL family protein
MIIDSLENYIKYSSVFKINEVFEFLKNLSPTFENGKIEIDNDLFVDISNYHTIPADSGKLESHKKYIDIQILLHGYEKIGWSPVSHLSLNTEYDENRDIMFYNTPDNFINFMTLTPGLFMIFYPDDAHMPQIAVNSPAMVKKAVFKIKI